MENKISKKLLGIALACALLTLAVAPSAFGNATATVTVGGNNTLTLTLNNNHLSPQFSGLTAFILDQSAQINLNSATTSTGDWIRVIDYTGTGAARGHQVKISMNAATWTYGGGIAEISNLTNRTTSAVGVNQASFRVIMSPGTVKASSLDPNICSVNIADATLLNSPVLGGFIFKLTPPGFSIINNLEACAGTFWYTGSDMIFKGSLNGLAPGTYQNDATITLVDGGNQ